MVAVAALGGCTGASTAHAPTTPAQLSAALLTPGEVGGSFRLGSYAPASAPQPCAPAGTPPWHAQVPPVRSAGRGFINASPPAVLEEELNTYPDAATAARAVAASARGMDCRVGSLYFADNTTTQVTIAGPVDLSAALGPRVDEAREWTVTSSAVQGSLLVVRTGRELAVLSFTAPASTDTAVLPDGRAIARRAVAKLGG